MNKITHILGRTGDLVYAVIFGTFVMVGAWAAGGALVKATGANSAGWNWTPIVFVLGVGTGIAAGREIRHRQHRAREGAGAPAPYIARAADPAGVTYARPGGEREPGEYTRVLDADRERRYQEALGQGRH